MRTCKAFKKDSPSKEMRLNNGYYLHTGGGEHTRIYDKYYLYKHSLGEGVAIYHKCTGEKHFCQCIYPESSSCPWCEETIPENVVLLLKLNRSNYMGKQYIGPIEIE